ncbi:R3H-associated N-terminal domain-containing protein [Lasiosphaeris hirsuta]|uniref:R3H-associated N-terminal domain-containing protein n=1 Tax=Lasiosphaeris hirsuta TaxID=260670 RepID=A0AA40AGT2_9PEZI|nr:R3H-associated N-terminal domain-containing protein [Lasiosphaeris hirsuta]
MAIETAPLTPPSEDSNTEPIATTSSTAHPHVHHQHTISNASTATLDIESWTVAALESLSIAPIVRGTDNVLSIPLDSDHGHSTKTQAPQMKLRGIGIGGGAGITPPRCPPSARDSMKRRDELRKGSEGSRQRRRWENDHLLHVPNVQPPLPTDWQVHPTHPVLPTVPYALAKYWDGGLRERAEERKAAFAAQRRMRAFVATGGANAAAGGGASLSAAPASAPAAVPDVGRVPRDLRATAKRTPAVKSWLRVLEEPVRKFLVDRGLVANDKAAEVVVESSTDSEDDEVVFIGRNGAMLEGKAWKKARRVGGGAEAGMVLDMLGDDDTGAFKRWLTHSISDYYGLDSKSVTVGDPARRVIYIGTKQLNQRHRLTVLPILPPPLWEMF